MPLSLFNPEDGPTDAALTVADVIDSYLRHCAIEGVHGPAAKADREFTFRLFRRHCGHLLIVDLRPYFLTDFVDQHPEWRSVSTRRAKANAIKAAFAWATNGERIERNPFRSVSYAEAERRPEMAEAIIEQLVSLGNKPYERAVRFLRLTGCRLTELCRAIWADVDLQKGIWIIPRHKSRRYTGKPKIVALVADAVELLRRLRESTTPSLFDESGIIFLNNRGTAWTRVTLGQQFRRLKKRHSIKTDASLHGIRHRAGSAMVAGGASAKLASVQLGHSTVAVFERYYCHLEGQIEAIRGAAEKGVPKRAE